MLGMALASCGGSGTDEPPLGSRSASLPSSQAVNGEFVDRGGKTTCPASVSETDSRAICKLVVEDLGMTRCADHGPGGFDVMASGVSCAQARQLRLPLGIRGFSSYRRPGEGVFRPWLATGPLADPSPVRAIGWTCWHRWDPAAPDGGIRNVCWSDSAIVLFKQG